MERKNDLCERLLCFAVDVILYLRTVKNTIETMDTKRQLIRASTSSGANYEESQGAPTKPDVRTKIAISLKEMREANYFLRIYYHLKLGDVEKNLYLVKESSEIKKILASILTKLSVFLFISWNLKFGTWNLGLFFTQ
ncbi:MAG: four helix bundle protein [Bacteroidota bacterium]